MCFSHIILRAILHVLKKLFENNDEDINKRCWIFGKEFTTIAGADQDLDISIVDVLCQILNRWKGEIPLQEKECFSLPTSM